MSYKQLRTTGLNTRLYNCTNTIYEYTIYFVQTITWVVVYKNSLDDIRGKRPIWILYIIIVHRPQLMNNPHPLLTSCRTEVRLYIDYSEKNNKSKVRLPGTVLTSNQFIFSVSLNPKGAYNP